MTEDRNWRRIGRGSLLCIALLLLPLVLLVWSEPPTLIWYVLLLWKGLVFPHDWLVQRTGHGFVALWLGYWALVVATVQWALCSLLIGWFTRTYSIKKQLALSGLLIVLIGVALLVGALSFGIEIQPNLL